jgi:hypothetical protein
MTPRAHTTEPDTLLDLVSDCLELPTHLASAPDLPDPRPASPQPLVIDHAAAPLLDGLEPYGSRG